MFSASIAARGARTLLAPRNALAALPSAWASAPSASYATLTRRRRKEMAKSAALEQRQVLAFARLFDPRRVVRAQVFQTLSFLGWDVLAGEIVGDGLVVDYTLREWYAAFDIVEAAHYVLPDAPNASDDCGFGPGVPPPLVAAARSSGSAKAGSLPRVTTPAETPFTHAPASWLSPVRGLMLDKDMAARHAAIRARGWKLAVIPMPLWETAASHVRDAHVSRRDLLMSLTMDLAPFEARPEQLQGLAARGRGTPRGPTAGDSAAAAVEAVFRKAAEQATEGARRDASASPGGVGGATTALPAAPESPAEAARRARAELVDAAELRAAEVESGAGRNRRSRSAARAKVEAKSRGV